MKGIDKLQHYEGWEGFHQQSVAERAAAFTRNGEPYDLIFAQQLSRPYCTRIFDLADAIRRIAKTKRGNDWLQTVCSDKRGMLFFVQPSTRTFVSFLNACHILGIKTSEIRNTDTSSEVKGESPEDTVRTFSSYVDVITMRHREEGFAERSAWVLNRSRRPVPVINGGSGKDEHPTQALLDLYTLHRAFRSRGGIDGKTVVMVGDLRRGRTVRSLAQLLANYQNVQLHFVAPEPFQVRTDIRSFLDDKRIPYTLETEMEPLLPKADAVYLTRIQDEYDEGGESTRIDYFHYHFLERHLSKLRQEAVIMHPFPRRLEIEISVDRDPRAHYWKQQRNGMWIRSAVLARMFERDEAITRYEQVEDGSGNGQVAGKT
jgi:aspartate carbamoyltransferase catalytic subunit